MNRALVFESDPAFASELRAELSRFGWTAEVVDHSDVGLRAAAADPPDLFLVSAELWPDTGFLVCNRLKKDPRLKAIPLLLLSSEPGDEMFVMHGKLRTRADGYVHKPITFAALLPHIQAHVPMRMRSWQR